MSNQDDLIAQFHRDGFVILPGIVPADEIEQLRAGFETAFAVPSPDEPIYKMGGLWRNKMFEQGEAFERLVDAPGTIDLIEAIVGADCHMISNNGLRTGPGEGITGWHVDDANRFPIPDGVTLDERIAMPCWVANMICYLCDVDEPLGPTQLVPGSHRSGRSPVPDDNDDNGNPVYNGRSAVSAVGPAGTCVIWNDQTWHRGAPNQTADRYRLAQAVTYGRRWVSQRFYPFVNYRMPADIIDRANPRRRRLLGLHATGAYG